MHTTWRKNETSQVKENLNIYADAEDFIETFESENSQHITITKTIIPNIQIYLYRNYMLNFTYKRSTNMQQILPLAGLMFGLTSPLVLTDESEVGFESLISNSSVSIEESFLIDFADSRSFPPPKVTQKYSNHEYSCTYQPIVRFYTGNADFIRIFIVVKIAVRAFRLVILRCLHK